MAQQNSVGGGNKQLALELYRAVDPIVSATRRGPEGIVEFVDSSGIGEAVANDELEKIVSVVEEELLEPSETIISLVNTWLSDDGITPHPEEVFSLIEAIKELIQGIQKLDDLSFEDASLDNVGETLLDYLIVEYLWTYHPDIHHAFVIVGVIKGSPPNEPGEIDLPSLSEAIKNPNAKATEVFDWGGADAYNDLGSLPHLLEDILWEHSIRSSVTRPESDEVGALTGVNDISALDGIDEPTDLESQLRIQLLTLPQNNVRTVIGLKLFALPGEDGTYRPGIGVLPYGSANISDGQSVSLGPNEDWTFSVTGSGATDLTPYGLDLRPDMSGELSSRLVDISQDAAADISLQARAELSYDGSTEDSAYTPVMGEADGTYLGVGQLSAALDVAYNDESGEVEVKVELPADGRLRVKPKGGFLEKVLPDEINSDIETVVGWSSANGLYVEGGATLEVALPLHQTLGPITLKEIYLSLGPDPESGALTTEASAAATVKLGPVTGTVDRMGIDAELSFPEDRDGNLGPADLELGFKPPKGVGLSVSTGPITGSGYLFFDPENERYGGAAQLKVSNLSLTALGLITTELPDGSDGFSMQVVVAGEFQPIQLGFGFTLTGVGGILGINRKFRTKALRRVVRTGSLDSVLFPEKETVKNNPMRLISDLRSVFPPKRGSYLFGPMVQLGFGTPAVLKSSLGVVLEIPSFRVLVVGRFELVLPNHEAERPSGMPEQAPWPPIVLNLDVMGKIDIPGKSISIDASLYDSRVLQWTVKGDMALRSSWGQDPRFILSVGGFNPRYTPPKDAPGLKSLDRVKVSLDVPGGQPVVEFTGYFAVTSNTFQVGAGVYAEINVGKFRIWGKLGFDALFRFSPFKFIFDFVAKYMIEGPSIKAAFSLDGTITGPTPFNINGKVKLTVGPVKVNTRIDVTLGAGGKSEKLPAAEVLPELVDALNHPKNWDAQLPKRGQSPVSIRGVATERGTRRAEQGQDPKAGPVLAHPLGTVTVRQSVVPLRYTIEKFGEARPKTYDRFEIVDIGVDGGTVDSRPVDGQFAPAQYRQMSDAEKLDSADFVRERAGRALGEEETLVGGESAPGNATRARFVYEEHLYDEGEEAYGEPLSTMTDEEAGHEHTAHSARSLVRDRKGPSRHDRGRFSVDEGDPAEEAGDEGGLFSVSDVGYVVVDAETFTPVVAGAGDGEDGPGAESPERLDATMPGRLSREAAREALTEYARRAGRSESDLRVVPEHVLESHP